MIRVAFFLDYFKIIFRYCNSASSFHIVFLLLLLFIIFIFIFPNEVTLSLLEISKASRGQIETDANHLF